MSRHHHHHHPTATNGGAPLLPSSPPPPPPPPKPSPELLSFVLKTIIMTFMTSLFFLFLGVAAILLLHLFLVGGLLHRHRRHTLIRKSSNGLSPEDLKKLPRFRFGKGIENSECVICLESFKENQFCRKLVDCNHVFHRNCVDTWLIKVAACPICRSDVSLNVGISCSAAASEDYKQSWGIRGNS